MEALVVKNPPANEGDIRDTGSSPGSGRSPEGVPGNPLQYACLENPRTEEPGRLQSIGSQRVRHDCSNFTHAHQYPVVWASNHFSIEIPLLFFQKSFDCIRLHLFLVCLFCVIDL